MNKEEIRKEILKIRDSQTEEEILEKSRKIKENLFLLEDFIKADNILFYYSFRSEVRTDIMIGDSRLGIGDGGWKKRIFLPKVSGENLKVYEIKSLSEVKPGYCGIKEPITKRPISLEDIELVLVPGVCFDKRGFRIGYGGGYYDRLLPLISCKKIGLAFSLQIVDKIPNAIRDIGVDKIITEDGVIIADCKLKKV
ncbi:MAG: 5-formyltetrahydrofolate cyclo-ligase [bacterium]